MEIHLESTESHTIHSYSDQSILVGQTTLDQSCIISPQTIQTTWPIRHLDELIKSDLVDPLLQYQPEVIIIGHTGPSQFLPSLASDLSRQRIGLECMSIGAACRTFNVLLSEGRHVVLGIIF